MYSKILQHVTVYYVFILFQVGLFFRDLADRFCMSATVLSPIFNTWIINN
jgi:hypothetical protein